MEENQNQHTTSAPADDTGDANQGNLIGIIHQNAQSFPDQVFLSWVNNKCNVENTITYAQLWQQTASVVEMLQRNGIKAGDRVMISYPFGLEFLAGLFGCMRAGVIPCSVYPPNPDKKTAKFSFEQFNNQVIDAGAKFACSTAQFKRVMKAMSLMGHRTNVKWLATDNIGPPKDINVATDRVIDTEDIAFIQYSSGSTGTPKGIMISHRAAITNLTYVTLSDKNWPSHNIGVCWLPQYHDYALTLVIMKSVLEPKDCSYMASPIDFIKNPILWADMIEKFKPTVTVGPNFSYALLAKRLKAAGRTLDGSSLFASSMGGEPIQPSTITLMKEIGFPEKSIYPGYGMAEICVFVTANRDIRVLDGRVSCGILSKPFIDGVKKKIVVADPSTNRIIHDGTEGEIFVRGPDLASGYWGLPEKTKETFRNKLDDGHEYLKTGDLGRIVDDHLYVCGRVKEVIIINGKNIYPTDLERTLETEFSHFVRPGSTVAYQCTDTEPGIVFELRKNVDREQVATHLSYQKIRALIRDSHELKMGSITILKQGTVPKTTSGKLKRVETRKMDLDQAWSPKAVLMSWRHTSNDCSEMMSSMISKTSKTINDSSEMAALDLTTHKNGQSHRSEEQVNVLDMVFQAVFGLDFEPNASWDDNGLTSIFHAELVALIDENFMVKLPHDFNELYPTPALLKKYIESNTNTPIETLLSDLPGVSYRRALPLPITLAFQPLGIVLQLCLLIISLVSAFYVGKATTRFWTPIEIGNTGKYVFWTWFLPVIPTFAASLSLLVICAKWLIIGRYRPLHTAVYSQYYLRWWFVDRLVDTWERWVGIFLLDTPVVWLFYSFMGANIHPKIQINAFLREFDLITIGKDTSIKHKINCRRFGPWSKDVGAPSLRFRPVCIGKRCDVCGIAALGSVMGDNSQVETMSVLAEGAQVPANTVATGNPAFSSTVDDGDSEEPSIIKRTKSISWMLLLMKLIWLPVQLYVFFSLFLLSQVIWIDRLPVSFRYTPLLYWILLFASTGVISLVLSAVVKRLLLGSRPIRNRLDASTVSSFGAWLCDYHFLVSTNPLMWFSSATRFWNIIYMLHGMDCDMQTCFSCLFEYVPSVMNQLKIRRSFLSAFTTYRDGEKIEIIDSSLGLRTIIGGGVKIHRSYVRSFTEATESIYDHDTPSVGVSVPVMLMQEILNAFLVVIECLCFIPAYEVFQVTVISSSSPIVACVGVAASVVTQQATWTLMYWCMQWVRVLLYQSKWMIESKVFHCWYFLYIHGSWVCATWCNWYMLWGTAWWKYYCSYILGTTVKGDLFFIGNQYHDYHAIVFQDGAVVDESLVAAHYAVGSDLVVGQSVIGGVLHQGCFTIAGTDMSDVSPRDEYGPYRPLLGKTTATTATAAASSLPSTPTHRSMVLVDEEDGLWASGEKDDTESTTLLHRDSLSSGKRATQESGEIFC